MHVVKIRRGQLDLYLTASVGLAVKGKETVQDMVAAFPRQLGTPLAAVNGDYFEFRTEPRFFGVPEGLCIIDGELVAGPAGSALCIDSRGEPRIRKVRAQFKVTWPEGSAAKFGLNCATSDYKSEARAAPVVLFTPRFGRSTGTDKGRELVLGPAGAGPWLPLKAGQSYRAKVLEIRRQGDAEIPRDRMVLSISRKADASVPTVASGDSLLLSTAFAEDMADVVTAVGGGPPLLADGRILVKPPAKAAKPAPRTAVGMNDAHIFLAVVDGRQADLSIGMSRRELAEFMQGLGCTEALNLDGGGSATLWLSGQVVNSPSGGRSRAVGNCLILLRRPKGAVKE